MLPERELHGEWKRTAGGYRSARAAQHRADFGSSPSLDACGSEIRRDRKVGRGTSTQSSVSTQQSRILNGTPGQNGQDAGTYPVRDYDNSWDGLQPYDADSGGVALYEQHQFGYRTRFAEISRDWVNEFKLWFVECPSRASFYLTASFCLGWFIADILTKV